MRKHTNVFNFNNSHNSKSIKNNVFLTIMEFNDPSIMFIITDILSVATAFMLGLLFITAPSDNRKANIFLGLSLWSLALEVLGALLNALEIDFFFINTSLLTLVFLLFYVLKTINYSIKPQYVLLCVPSILTTFFEVELPFLEYIFNIGILVAILYILKNHKAFVNNFYSDLEHKTLQWIKIIVFIYLGFHLLWIIEDIVSFQNEDITEYFAGASNILTLFMIYWIGYNGFSQHETFKQRLFNSTFKDEVLTETSEEDQFEIEKEDVIIDETLDEKETVNEDETDISKYEAICETISSKKLFTNPKLNLRTLSKALKINQKEVSRLINTHSKTNFYQFINRFRVGEFKRLINSPKAKQLSILGLSEEAGFNSKSTFYTAFKTLEGITPKQYEAQLKQSE